MSLLTSRCFLAIGLAAGAFIPRALSLDAEDVLYFNVGALTLKPQASLSEVYNDNIFYLHNNPVSDLITIISPGLKLQLGRVERNYISLNYTYDQLLYADDSNLNAGQHTIEIRDKLQAQRLTLVGSDRIQLLSSPLGGVERILTSRNIERTSFDDNYTLSYGISEKTEVYARANYLSLDYQQGIGLYDIDTLTGTAGFAYLALPKTTFFGEVYYGETQTNPNSPLLPKNPSLTFVGGYLGARGDFTSKLAGQIKVGYESREFTDRTSAPSDPVVDLSLIQRFSEKTTLALSFSRQNNVSSQYTRQSYTVDLIALQLRQLFGTSRKWEATVGGSYSDYAYDLNGKSTGVTYQYARASLALAYHIRLWLTANLGYDFDLLSSSGSAVTEYKVNRVNFRLVVGY